MRRKITRVLEIAYTSVTVLMILDICTRPIVVWRRPPVDRREGPWTSTTFSRQSAES